MIWLLLVRGQACLNAFALRAPLPLEWRIFMAFDWKPVELGAHEGQCHGWTQLLSFDNTRI